MAGAMVKDNVAFTNRVFSLKKQTSTIATCEALVVSMRNRRTTPNVKVLEQLSALVNRTLEQFLSLLPTPGNRVVLFEE